MIASCVSKERVIGRRKINSSLVSSFLNFRGHTTFAQVCGLHVMPWLLAMLGFKLLLDDSKENNQIKIKIKFC
jgi:hypothetical protein